MINVNNTSLITRQVTQMGVDFFKNAFIFPFHARPEIFLFVSVGAPVQSELSRSGDTPDQQRKVNGSLRN